MAATGGAARPGGLRIGVTALVGSILSVQLGASLARRLIDDVPTPLGAVWLRLTSAAVFMLVFSGVGWLVRRRRRAHSSLPDLSGAGPDAATPGRPASRATVARPRHALAVTVVFGAAMLSMNAAIYEAFDRLPVGIAITLEFLGPLGVAIVTSLRRGRGGLAFDLGVIACAGAGVALLGVAPVSLNLLGTLFALVSAACWAVYIVLGARVTRWYTSDSIFTVLWVAAALIFLGPALAPAGPGFLTPGVLGLAVVVGLTCSVIPSLLELFTLARVPPGLFAILESLAPAVAALGAWFILGQRLHPTDWLAIALVVLASVGATLSNARR